jgi:hypothetical protein
VAACWLGVTCIGPIPATKNEFFGTHIFFPLPVVLRALAVRLKVKDSDLAVENKKFWNVNTPTG